MESKRPLLSICIPTYNRSAFLRDALDNITLDPDFDERVEVIVSDNASTDNTPDVVASFCKEYSNIKYYKNEANIKDQNFYLAISRGSGRYVRLFNDTLRFKKNALSFILQKIATSDEKFPLFFYDNTLDFKNCNFKGYNINSFIEYVSYNMTWIANFGGWKEDIDEIVLPYRYSKLQLSQVDWTLQIVDNHSCFALYIDDLFCSIVPQQKGGYNFFEVFVKNYLSILAAYSFDNKYIYKEKVKLLKYHIMPWCWKMYIQPDKFKFNTRYKWPILLRYYYLCPTFYLEIIKYCIKIALNKMHIYK